MNIPEAAVRVRMLVIAALMVVVVVNSGYVRTIVLR